MALTAGRAGAHLASTRRPDAALLAKQDANLHLTTFEYDALARRTAEHPHLDAHARLTPSSRGAVPGQEALNLPAQAGTLTRRRTYDASGNVLTETDVAGQVATNTWGLRNRLDAVTFSGHQTPRALPSVEGLAWGFDENGNVTDVTQTKRTSSGLVAEVTLKTYDGLDRLESERRHDGKLTTYGHDAAGNRTRVTDYRTVATTYTFDALHRLSTATTPAGAAEYRYFEDGLLKSLTFPSGVEEWRCYDAAGRLEGQVSARTSLGATPCPLPAAPPANPLSRFRYGFDAGGNRTVHLEERTPLGGTALGAVETTEYGYDDEDRLIGVKAPDGVATLYQLDAVGNRVGERKAPSSLVPSLTAAAFLAVSPSALTSDILATFNRVDEVQTVVDSKQPAKDATFTFDVNGLLVRQQTAARDRALRWDARGTLTEVLDDGLLVGRYDYAADGLRQRRETGLSTVEYVLDGDEVLLEVDSTRPTPRRFHYGAAPLAVADAAGTSWLGLDALGSLVTASSAAGAVTAVRQYDAFGQYRNGTAPAVGEVALGYTGHQYDAETGLTYARARYYDAEYGRFLSRDSFEGSLDDAPSLHRYAYARVNPLRYTDPDGRAAACLLGGFIGCTFDTFNQLVLTAGAAKSGNTSAAVGYAEADLKVLGGAVAMAADPLAMLGPGALLAKGLVKGASDVKECVAGGGGGSCLLDPVGKLQALSDSYRALGAKPASEWTASEGSTLHEATMAIDKEAQKLAVVASAAAAGGRMALRAATPSMEIAGAFDSMAAADARAVQASFAPPPPPAAAALDEAAALAAREGEGGALATGSQGTAPSAAPVSTNVRPLLAGEGRVATFDELDAMRVKGDDLTPHHIPSSAYMEAKNAPAYSHGEGISIWMEQPRGPGGRHRLTSSYGNQPDLTLTPREVLAREVWNARAIYRSQGLYTPAIRSSLRRLIELNKQKWAPFFDKPPER